MVNFKEASHYKKLPNKKVHCLLCPHNCIIDNGEVGKCNVRMNINGSLKAMNYSKLHTVKQEVIEDFPIYHFFPGSKTLSIGSAGENLEYKWNKNEFYGKSFNEIPTLNQDPIKVIKQAENSNINIIAHKYSEPLMSFEFIRDISKKSPKFNHVIVSNGFFESIPAKELTKRISAALFDIHSMSESFYENILKGKLDSVLNTIKIFYDNNVWVEIKMTLVKEVHDNMYDVKKLVSWILNKLDANVPLHLISYDKANYKPNNETMEKARKIAKGAGMNYVYLHGIEFNGVKTTFCPNCTKPIIYRDKDKWFNYIKDGKCKCGKEIAGVW